MRLPNRTALSEEQERIFLNATMDEPVLVSGAPGTGKTVIAIYRLHALHNRSKSEVNVKPPRLLMYSRVLKKYTESAIGDLDEQSNLVSTWHSWLYQWWKTSASSSIENDSSGGFDKMYNAVLVSESPNDFSWGHIVIDEAQDFPRGFYELMHLIRRRISKLEEIPIPSITVLADDNQRMDKNKNSTTKNIVEDLNIKDTNRYELKKNYRNTLEIARFCAVFYTGLPTGIAEFPDNNNGELPILLEVETFDQEIERIVTHTKNYGRHHVGVFVPRDKIREKIVRALKKRLKGSGIGINTYSSVNNGTGVDHLDFEAPSQITVLCDQSCKGLEFDAVFIPQLQTYKSDGDEETYFKMKFYVMCSRARTHLTLSYSGCDSGNLPNVISLLPDPQERIHVWKTK